LDILNALFSFFMRVLRVISAVNVVAIPSLKQVSKAKKQSLGVVGCCCVKNSAQWDLPPGRRNGYIWGGRAVGSGFALIVLISCFGFAKYFFTSEPQSESSAFRPATFHWISSSFAPLCAIAVRRLATSDSTGDGQSLVSASPNTARSNRQTHSSIASSVSLNLTITPLV
jgi:hypothetical protein